MDIRDLKIKKIYRQDNFKNEILESSIAVICYGHLRSFLYSLQETLYSISQLGEVHLFMHTWDTIDSNEDIFTKNIDLPNLIRATCNNIELISLQIDSQQIEKIKINQDKKKSHPSAYMYYSMWNANLQKKEFENKLLKRYKYCIKIRPDILLHENIKLLDLNIPQYFCDQNQNHFNIVACSSSKTMDQLCSFVGRLDSSISEDEIQKDHKDYIVKTLGLKPSTMLLRYWNKNLFII